MRYPEGKLQKVVFWGGITLIILMLLFPPLVAVRPHPQGGTFYGESRGYHFILDTDYPGGWVRIDLVRLVVQILPIAIIIALVLWRAGQRPKPGQCIAKTENGIICGQPATIQDSERGGLVCQLHASPTQEEV